MSGHHITKAHHHPLSNNKKNNNKATQDDLSTIYSPVVTKKKENKKEETLILNPILDEKHELWIQMFGNPPADDPLHKAAEKLDEERKRKKRKAELEELRKLRNKKNPPKPKNQKIKSFFSDKKNFQGKPMKYCHYEDEVGLYVYDPPGYGEKNQMQYIGFSTSFCRHCLLKPCLVAEFHEDLYSLGDDMEHNTLSSQTEIREAVFDLAFKNLEPFLGKRYVKKMQVPYCLSTFADSSWLESSDSESEQDADAEEELFNW